ncbi:MAG: putative inorganic carbon transporter subunit DabA [Myxococcaceae bacterium]
MPDVEGLLQALRAQLPIQNPLWAFLHNNILQGWEGLPFHEALRLAGPLYRARGYETEAFYRAELARGRISRDALAAVLAETLPGIGVDTFLSDETCGDDVERPVVHRGAATFDEYDRRLQDLVVPVVSTWLDQGIAPWSPPFAAEGLWAYFAASVTGAPSWGVVVSEGLRARVRGHAGRTVAQVITAELENVPEEHQRAWCAEVLFALKGWSGMVNRLEQEPGIAPVAAPRPSLTDWLAVLLVACHYLDGAFGLKHAPGPAPGTEGLGRLRRFHEAYERTFATDFLGHLERHGREARPPVSSPAVQVMGCMDDRGESLRRALEADANVETIGTVGFFGVDMAFAAVGRSRPTRQSPPTINPSRVVREEAIGASAETLDRERELESTRQGVALTLWYQVTAFGRALLLSLTLGLMSFFPLILRSLLPGPTARFQAWIRRIATPRFATRLALSSAEGGYSDEEQAQIVCSLLRSAGVSRFAPLFVVLGHGSTSTNNPFRQAYGCGACSGNSGASNARAFVTMANSPLVRRLVKERGLDIPEETVFVAAHHDTALDEFELLDTEGRHPTPAQRAQLLKIFRRACEADAVERARRFDSAPASRGAVLAHVRERAHDLAEPRPEYGHNRVALCIVGRRALTRGLFLDRRAFLVSYDPTTDPDGQRLADAVVGSVPVAVNIAMDYYFSRVDPHHYGAGSKLPLNIVSLLGVITGSKSDLRLGLARQMVELHEPMRPLVLIEAAREHLDAVIEGDGRLRDLVRHDWARLGRIDPATGAMEWWTLAGWVPWRTRFPEAAARELPVVPPVLDAAFDVPLEVTS